MGFLEKEYIKLFNTEDEYQMFRISYDYYKPNVSVIKEPYAVYYNKFDIGAIIKYKASEKLSETTSDKNEGGLHTNQFSGTSGQQLTIIRHTFENGIGTIEFDECVSTIGRFAFLSATTITEVTLPYSVTTILGDIEFGGALGGAFNGCSSLVNIFIPYDCTNLYINSFNNTPWWINYSADTNNQYGNIIYINDVAYMTTSTGITSCTFKETTVSIGGGAFNNCSGLTSIDIPNSVTSIGDSAFQDCSSLTSVTIPNSVTSIGHSAFSELYLDRP